MLAETIAARVRLALDLRFIVFVVAQKFFGRVEPVNTWLAMIKVRWWKPFGVAVVVFAGGPALFCELVVGSAAEGQVVDIGFPAFSPGRAVVNFGVVAGHVAAREATPTVLGIQHYSLSRRS
jgi:hypothetical protein